MKTKKEYLSYTLIQPEFLEKYTFNQFKEDIHINVYIDNEILGSIRIPEYLDCLVDALKKSKQFIHINVQKFIQQTQAYVEQYMHSKQPASWRMEGNVLIHALKEIQLFLIVEHDIKPKWSNTFYTFDEMYELLNMKNGLDFNTNPIFTFKIIEHPNTK